jgi:acyl-[acyl carrier protein]--UDP-N-acetylglucosamine O-acyltransferase
MKQAHAPKAAWVLGAVVLLGLAALAGCTLIGDNITGVTTNGVGPTSCVKQCNDLYKTLYDQEQKLHQTNKEACQALAQPDKGNCLVAEDARHTAAQAALGDAKIDCQNNCHRQGTGSAG